MSTQTYYEQNKDKVLLRCKEYRDRNRAKGICISCGTQPVSGKYVTCPKCLDNSRIHGENYKERRNENHRLLKEEVFSKYGSVCNCCREYRIAFLSIDHVDGGGNIHRKQVKSNIYRWLKRNNYPEGFQLLCHNCNHGKHINGGICPHQQEKNVYA